LRKEGFERVARGEGEGMEDVLVGAHWSVVEGMDYEGYVGVLSASNTRSLSVCSPLSSPVSEQSTTLEPSVYTDRPLLTMHRSSPYNLYPCPILLKHVPLTTLIRIGKTYGTSASASPSEI